MTAQVRKTWLQARDVAEVVPAFVGEHDLDFRHISEVTCFQMPLANLIAAALCMLKEGELVLVIAYGIPDGYPFNHEALDQSRLAFHWCENVPTGPRVFIVRYGDF